MRDKNVRKFSRQLVLCIALIIGVYAATPILRSLSGSVVWAESLEAGRTIDVKKVNIKFTERWISLAEIERIARDYVRERDPNFNHVDSHTSMWIEGRHTGLVVTVGFRTSLGGNAWNVYFATNGTVNRYASGLLGEK